MGGRGSGGNRVGAGRKPWKVVPKDGAPPAAAVGPLPTANSQLPTPNVPRPKLPPAVRKVWDDLAPLATKEGTLVPATAYEFETMCRLAVQQSKVLKEFERQGLTEFGLKLEKAYRGLTQRLETKLRAFKLAPMGKEIAPAAVERPKSALELLRERKLRAV